VFGLGRDNRQDDPWLALKTTGFVVGALLAFLGMVTGTSLLIQVAIGVLVLSWMTRLLGRRSGPEGFEEFEDPEE
jgi:multisubunit Na+/H+ antiporter MnhF subunit